MTPSTLARFWTAKSRPLVSCALVILVLLTFGGLAFGQGIVTGGVTGVVIDPQGAVVPNATVTLTNQATNVSLTAPTDQTGTFRFNGVPIGSYRLSVSAQNFSTLTLQNTQVVTGNVTNVGRQALSVASGRQEVTVEATAPMIESTTAQVQNTYDTEKLANLPINGTLDTIALLAPGVASAHEASFSNSNAANNISLTVNGQRGRSNNFEIDGQNNNDNSVGGPAFFFSNQDAVQEIQVITNNFSAEYGRNMGSVVNYVTKSGTNQFHGTGFEYYTGSFLNSLANQDKSPLLGFCGKGQTPTANGCTAITVPRSVENRWGGSFGGPILKDRLWFFGSTNWDHVRTGATPSTTGSSITPTPTGIATLGAALPGNPAVAWLQQFGPFAVKAGNPAPTGVTSVNVVLPNGSTLPVQFAKVTRLVPGQSANNDEEVTGRLDWQATSKDRVFVRYQYQTSAFNVDSGTGTGAGIASGNWVNVPNTNHQGGFDWTRSFTPSMVNQFRYAFFQENVGFEGGSYPTCTRANITACPPRVNFSGGNLLSFGLSNNLPQGRFVKNHQFQDNATWVHGRHEFKFGGEYDQQISPNVFLPNVNGTLSFTSGVGASCTGQSTAGCVFGHFLAQAGTATLADGPIGFNFREKDVAAYFQDNWHIADNLTLNLGMRWEWFQQAENLLHDLTASREAGSGAFWNSALPLDARTFPKIPEDKNNFGPAIGFAWQPLHSMNTVIRGGYRINYDPAFYNIFLNSATSAPVVNLGSFSCGGSCLPSTGTGAAIRSKDLGLLPRGSDPRARNETFVSPNFHNPYAQNYTLGVQQQIGRKVVGEVRYAGNHTVGNFQSLNANPLIGQLAKDFPSFVPAGTPVCTTPGQPGTGREFCPNGNVRVRANTAFSIYNSMQTRMNWQGLFGSSGGVSYTWSKTIDNASEIFGTFAGGNTVAFAQNPLNSDIGERGLSGVSYPNTLAVNVSFQTPWFRNQPGIFGRLLGGYGLGIVYTYNSGQPLSTAQFAGEGSGNPYCDNAFMIAFSSAVDNCRPVLSNPNAPLNTVGIYTSPGVLETFEGGSNSGTKTTATAVHWIVNDINAVTAAHNPFPGSSRNIIRGQSWNNVDASLLKSFRVSERVKFQLQANVVNLLNHQYRGAPDPFIEDYVPSDVTSNSFMNNFFNDSLRRTVTLGGKIIF